MNRNGWKKIIGIILILGVLIFSFWYGGNSPGLQGFSIDEETGETTFVDSDVVMDEGNGKASKSLTTDKKLSDNAVSEDNNRKDDKGSSEKTPGLLKQIVMKIKKVSSGSGKNLQLSKKAQKNANKSIHKRKKTNKKNDKTQDSNALIKNDENKNDNDSEYTDNNINGSNSNAIKEVDNNSTEDSASTESKVTETSASTESKSNETIPSTEAKATESSDKDNNSITCTIYISCASVLDNMDKLSDSTKKVIPDDGVILKLTEVKVKEGDTVFDVLQKAARESKVHLEYNYTPAYKTYYIEGIGNLYQFDVGNLSGWMYSVNNEFPGIGCSGYKVKDGDSISWLYTCNFGKDVGD